MNLLTVIMAALGFAVGLGYFALLRRSVNLYRPGSFWGPVAVLALARFALATGFFVVAARSGALPLLGAFLGFLVARAVALRGSSRPA